MSGAAWWTRHFKHCGSALAWDKNRSRSHPRDIAKLVTARAAYEPRGQLVERYVGERGVLRFTAWALDAVAEAALAMRLRRWSQDWMMAEVVNWAAESEEHCRAAIAVMTMHEDRYAFAAKQLVVLAGYGHELVGYEDPRDEHPD